MISYQIISETYLHNSYCNVDKVIYSPNLNVDILQIYDNELCVHMFHKGTFSIFSHTSFAHKGLRY